MAPIPKKPLKNGKEPSFPKGGAKVKPSTPPSGPSGGDKTGNRDAARKLLQGGKYDS